MKSARKYTLLQLLLACMLAGFVSAVICKWHLANDRNDGAAEETSAAHHHDESSLQPQKTRAGDSSTTPAEHSHAHKNGREKMNSSTQMDDNEDEVPILGARRHISSEGNLESLHNAYEEVQAAVAQMKDGAGSLPEIDALIDGFAFNGDWSMYLRLYARKELLLPLSIREKDYVTRGTYQLNNLFGELWRSELNEWSRRIKPISKMIEWARVNAPAEYKMFREQYSARARGQWDAGYIPPPMSTLKGYANVDARTDWLYKAFYEALEKMPPDSRIFTEYLGVGQAPPPAGMAPAARVTDTPAPSGTAEPPPAPERAAAPPPEPPSGDPRPEDAAAELERFDLHEGLRRLAEADKAWAESVAEWARAREAARRGEAPPIPPAPPEPPDDNDDNPPFPPR